MSFFGKLKGNGASSAPANSAAKKEQALVQPTPLEKLLRDTSGPPRPDGSDKFFGFENYGSTCYCSSIIQCLYYSAPFRSHVLNFPPTEYVEEVRKADVNGSTLAPRSTSRNPYPNTTSPARKDPATQPAPANNVIPKPEESKDSPEYKKRMALKAGPVLEMIHDRSNSYGMDESLFTALKDIFDAIKNSSSHLGVVSPHKFLDILRRDNEMFRSAMHQDAHEFLNLLLNQVVDSVELFSKQHPSLSSGENGTADSDGTVGALDTRWVHELFEGLLTSETRCLTCETTSRRDEPFLDLSVDLNAHNSVTSCLRKFSEEEMLCERNKFHCDNCGGLQEAEKRMKIKRLPRVLALHLKRFKYTEDLQRLQKLFHRVAYPFYLRLFNTTDDASDPDRLYELYAVVVHIGGGPYHGHYVSIVKTQDRGWLLFDDELVEPVDKSYVESFFGGEPIPSLQDARQLACAYVLFYQETTLEAMVREQEMEGQKPTATAAATAAAADAMSDTEAPNDPISPISSPTKPNGIHRSLTTTLPAQTGNSAIADDASDSSNAPLTHAITAPGDVTAAAAPTDSKRMSRKELKAAERERKAAAKAEAKILDERRRVESARRLDAWRQAQSEMATAIEASKQTAAVEARARVGADDTSAETPNGETSPALAAGNGGSGGGGLNLSRFRHGSLSLRNKPKWISNAAAQVTANGNGVAREHSSDMKMPVQHEEGDTHTELLSSPIVPSEDRTKRNRFSLGRKRSQAMA